MSVPIVFASSSTIRAELLRNAAVPFEVDPARIDEEKITEALLAEGASSRDVADALAEQKALKISRRHSGAMVLGCDQVLDFGGSLLTKPRDPANALDQLRTLRGRAHHLYSAAVICEAGQPVWRHIGKVTLRMREASDSYLEGYVARNWPGIGNSVGAYNLEEEGVRLFTSVEGDYFTVLGMPLLHLLNYLTLRGHLES